MTREFEYPSKSGKNRLTGDGGSHLLKTTPTFDNSTLYIRLAEGYA